jgi:hypothetical protein
MDISIIIVEYKNLKILQEAISSVQKSLSDVDFEIVVVSNTGYSARRQKRICVDYPTVKFIFNQSNMGFSKGVNRGIVSSHSRFVLLLNPDAKILNNGVSRAIECMEANPQIAILGPQIIDRTGEIQDSARDFMTPRKLLLRTFRRLTRLSGGGIIENKDHSRLQPVDWISGACMLVRQKAIRNVGLMDERYFMYVEDMDWCRRFWKHGWEVWYQPNWKVEHNAERGSTKCFTLGNRLARIHLISLCKYYFKWL